MSTTMRRLRALPIAARTTLSLALCGLLLFGSRIALSADVAIATVDVGNAPVAVAVNPVSHQVYVANFYDNSVSIIDGVSDVLTATVSMPILGASGANPNAIVVDSIAARPTAYVANWGSHWLSAIDEASQSETATLRMENAVGSGGNPRALALDAAAGKLYVANYHNDDVSVVDAETLTLIDRIPVGASPRALGIYVDGSRRRVFAANRYSDTVSIIDAASDAVTATVAVGSAPKCIAVDSSTGFAYVTNEGSDTLTVIDDSDAVTATVSVGGRPVGVAVDTSAGRVFVANYNDGTVSVIRTSDFTHEATVTVGTNPYAIAFDQGDSKAFVTNYGGTTVSVINGALAVTNVTAGNRPYGIAVNEGIDPHKAYAANWSSDDVTVIDEPAGGSGAFLQLGVSVALAAEAPSDVAVTIDPLGAVDEWDHTPSFTGSAKSVRAGAPSAIAAVFWRIDDDAAWQQAELASGAGTSDVTWRADVSDPLEPGNHTLSVLAVDETGAAVSSSEFGAGGSGLQAGGTASLAFETLDVPTAPSPYRGWASHGYIVPGSLASDGEYISALLVDQATVLVYDASASETIAPVGSITVDGPLRYTAAVADTLWLATQTDALVPWRLQVVDLTDAAAPRVTGSWEWDAADAGPVYPSEIHGLEANGEGTFLNDDGTRVLFMPAGATEATFSVIYEGDVTSMVLDGTRLYVGTTEYPGGTAEHGLAVIDVSTPTAPSLLSESDVTASGCSDVLAASTDAVVLAQGSAGVAVWDASDPSSPTLAATYREDASAGDWWSVALVGTDLLYGHDLGVSVVDVSAGGALARGTRVAPPHEPSMPTWSGPRGLAVAGDDVFVAGWKSMWTFDCAAVPDAGQVAAAPIGGSTEVWAGAYGRDPDDPQSLRTDLASAPEHGTAEVSVDWMVVTYAPDSGFAGADAFAYALASADPSSTPQPEVVPVRTYAQTPDFLNGAVFGCLEDYGSIGAVHLLEAAAHLPAAAPWTFELVSGPAHGTGNISSDGHFTYTPDPDYWGTDTMSYLVHDELGATWGTYHVTLVVSPTPDDPTLAAMSAYTGPPGTAITFTGSDFGAARGDSWVTFGGVPAEQILSWSEGEVVAVVPPGAVAGYAGVVVDGVATNGKYFVPVERPQVAAISPGDAAAGAHVTITGTGFGDTQGGGYPVFSGVPADVVSWSATEVVAVVPGGIDSGYAGIVQNGLVSNGRFFVPFGLPAIDSLSNDYVFPGTRVTVSGSSFRETTGTLAVAGVPIAPVSWTDTQVVFDVPADAPWGYVGITQDGRTSNGKWMTIVPRVDSVSRWWASEGTTVAIRGVAFGDGTDSRAILAGSDIEVVSWTPTEVIARIPAGADSGYIGVVRRWATSNGKWLTVETQARIDAVDKNWVSVGETMTVTGADFGAPSATSWVSIGGVICETVSWTDTTIVARVPAGAQTGYVGVYKQGVPSNGVWTGVR